MYRGEYMKNAISYYYNLYPNDIHQTGNNYLFFVNNKYYVLTIYNRNIEELEDIYNLSNEMLKNGIYTHQILPNKDNNILTMINNNYYILMQLYDEMKNNVKLEEVIIFSNLTTYIEKNKKLRRDDWGILWSNKIDYFEYQVNQFGKKYPIIRESFSYFVGLTENGISLYNALKKDENNIVVSHVRINPNSTYYDLYNPLNFVLDYPVRDISEYLKTKFINGEDIFKDLKFYLSYYHLSSYEMIMLFIRMMYPSFYFDKYEEIMAGKAKEEELYDIIEKIDDYQLLLKNLYIYLSYYTNMPDIDWLKK